MFNHYRDKTYNKTYNASVATDITKFWLVLIISVSQFPSLLRSASNFTQISQKLSNCKIYCATKFGEHRRFPLVRHLQESYFLPISGTEFI